jgi:hypothetical protein
VISLFDRFRFREQARGYLRLTTLTKGESRWFWTAGREFGLWYLTVHGFGLYFTVIGPFGLKPRPAGVR